MSQQWKVKQEAQSETVGGTQCKVEKREEAESAGVVGARAVQARSNSQERSTSKTCTPERRKSLSFSPEKPVVEEKGVDKGVGEGRYR